MPCGVPCLGLFLRWYLYSVEYGDGAHWGGGVPSPRGPAAGPCLLVGLDVISVAVLERLVEFQQMEMNRRLEVVESWVEELLSYHDAIKHSLSLSLLGNG